MTGHREGYQHMAGLGSERGPGEERSGFHGAVSEQSGPLGAHHGEIPCAKPSEW